MASPWDLQQTGAPSPYATYMGGGSYQAPQQMVAPAPSYGGGAYQPGAYGSTPDTYFTDPLTQPIMAAWGGRMQQLSRPAPGYGDINRMLGGYMKPDPKVNAALAAMASVAKGPGAKAAILANPYMKQLAEATEQRKGELRADPFSTAEEAALKARFFDQLAQDRDAAYQQNAAAMAQRGLAPSSGVAQALGAETSAGYQKARAAQQQALLQYVTDERNRRRDLAVSLSGNLQQAGLAETSLAQEAGLRNAALQQEWQGQRSNILGNVIQALMAQRTMGMNAATTMAGLRRQEYMDDMSRGESLLNTSALPSAIAQQRMQALQQVLAGGATPQSLYQQYVQQQQLQNQRDSMNAQQNAALWSGILGAAGQLGGAAINTWGGGGGNTTGR